MDEAPLRKVLGSSALNILQLDATKALTSSHLAELILSTYTPQQLLNNNDFRDDFLNQLDSRHALPIAQALGFKEGDKDLYSYLLQCSISKKAQTIRQCLNYFGIEYVSKEKVEYESSQTFIRPNYSLYPHQFKVMKECREALVPGARLMLHMPTGSGKTRTAMTLLCDLLREKDCTIIWIASTSELCDQAADEFVKAWSFLGNKDTALGKLYGKHQIDLNIWEHGMLVCSIQKLHAIYSKDPIDLNLLGQKSSFVVFDEAHQSLAPTYLNAVERLLHFNRDSSLLGLSATPGRTYDDIDEDKKLADIYDAKKILLKVDGYPNPLEYMYEAGFLARPYFRSVHYTSSNTPQTSKDLDYSNKYLKQIGEDAVRNKLIVEDCQSLLSLHKRIIVFAPSVDSANVIAMELSRRGVWAKSLTGESDMEERSEFVHDFKEDDEQSKVLCNYGVLTAGFDAPRTTAVLIARPTKSLILFCQMVGRAMRGAAVGGSDTCEIVTVVDTTLPGFRDLAEAIYNWEDVWE